MKARISLLQVLLLCRQIAAIPSGFRPLFQLDLDHSQAVVIAPSEEQSPPTVSLRRKQDDALCEARTEHYTGSVPLDHGKEIFYCMKPSTMSSKYLGFNAAAALQIPIMQRFFESMDSPKGDPIIIWLSGGPGGASTFAAMTEVGPCFINTTDNTTYYNPYNWAKHANLLIVDQPAGVGFSKPSSNASFRVETLEQASVDFNIFLHKFFTLAFPELAENDIHLAAESYGGRWGPAFVHHLVGLQNVHAEISIKNPIKSLILVNAVIGALGGLLTTADYEFGCTDQGKAVELGLRFNDTACEALQKLGPQCERYAGLCERENDLEVCRDASKFCQEKVGVWMDLKGRSPYNIQNPCLDPFGLCIGSIPAVEDFFSSEKVLHKLGRDDYPYSIVSTDILEAFATSGAMTQSVLRDVEDLIEHTPVRMLFLNGDLDALVITSGQKRIVDMIPWSGQLDYRQQQWRDWHYTNSDGEKIRGGQVKNSTKLRFVSFDGAGHMVPQDQPEGALAVLTEWLTPE
ncbi:Alpha/Beta hydrolase protein [Dactylonectria macrodidyma]|uniref:Carboxypeptidase n=1 Tax=Dactylonectria macrodidyma TaxID=307937 RepID=A0A9P9FHN6_9HYPO|nr:Alpha/Beta hydrolase protein [Dactylonectria macrodidyma]